MKSRFIVTLVAGVLASSSVALANHDSFTRPTMFRQPAGGPLLEVSADPRDGTDYVDVGFVRANKLVLVARNDVVDLHSMTIRFSDGRSFQPQHCGSIRPGERFEVELPRQAGPIARIELDYGRPELRFRDRTDARLQIYAVADRDPCDDDVAPPIARDSFYRDPYYRDPYSRDPYAGRFVSQQRFRDRAFYGPSARYRWAPRRSGF